MSKKYIPEGSWLACDKGTCPSSFRISHNNNTKIYGSKLASEADLLPFFNIKPMGFCSVSKMACSPVVFKWDDPQEGVRVNNYRLLKEDSTCKCLLGGTIKIYFDRGSAAAACVAGEIKMPTEYIKEGFDWIAEKNAKLREERDALLPDWMKSVTHVTDWMEDFSVGLAEGAINGVVGMGEGIYQIAQDPVGTAEAIGGMVGDGYTAAKEGLTNAMEWGSKGDNWNNAYNSTKTWVSNSENWKGAANSAWESTKEAGDWVAKNPRTIGTTVGQFIPDVVAAVYTAGGSEALTAAKLAAKEAARLAEEAAARQLEKAAAKKLLEEEAARLGTKLIAREGEEVVGKVVVKSEAELAEEAATKAAKEVEDLPCSKKSEEGLCKLDREPVDLISGRVTYDYTDFELPGPIPIRWKRVWDSDSGLKGSLGFATHLCYTRYVRLINKEEVIAILLADGRPAVCPLLMPGELFYHPQENFTISRKQNGHFLLEAHKENLYYHFNHEVSTDLYMLSLIEDYSGFRVQLHYAGKHLSGITDSINRQLLFNLNQKGCITEVELIHKGQRETLMRYDYNLEGDLIRITDALGQHTTIAFNNHLMTSKTDRNGQTFYWEYDNQKRCVHTGGTDGTLEGWIEYHKGFNVVINSLKETTTYYYNEDNLCVQETDDYGNNKFTEYTQSGQLYRETDEEGITKSYTYDKYDRLKEVVNADGTKTKYSYNDHHQLIMITYPDAAVQTYVYDKQKRIKGVTYPNGNASSYEYNDNGLLGQVTAKGGIETLLEYDNDANLTKVTFPDSSFTIWRYDSKGRCLESVNTEGQRRQFTYDELNRVKSIYQPDGNTVRLKYNAYEDITEASDKLGSVQFEYTTLGLVKKRKQNNTELKFNYDTEQRLNYITNEAGKIYRFGYNKRGEITREVGFDDLERGYERDKAGKIIKTKRPGGRSNEYEYDANGRIIRTEYHDGTWEIFNYDKSGNLKEAGNAFSSVCFKRNSLGLVEEEIQDGYTSYRVQSKYDLFGNRTGIQSSLGANIEQERDKAGNVTKLQAKIDEMVWEAQMKYNRAGQEIEKLLPGNILSQWQYDYAGRPLKHAVKKGGQYLRSKEYHWKVDDRLTSIFDALNQSSTRFRYDDFSNLIWVQYADNSIIHRSADATGNLYETADKSDRQYGAGGKLLETKRHLYKYDEEGNLISKTDKQTLNKWHYEWYANGMLKQVVKPDGKEVTFKYDALGRRIEKCFDRIITRWIWDHNIPLHEWQYPESKKPEPVINESGKVTYNTPEPTNQLTTWIFDADSFRPAAKIINGQTHSIICDYLGTPQEMYNEQGTKVWEGVLDIYGRMVTLKGNRTDCPFRYQGQYEDEETGLYYNRYRYYTPQDGLYISQDPISLQGGIALYRYVHDPNGWIDMFGLNATPETAAQFEQRISRMTPDERVHAVRGKMDKVAKRNGWEKDTKLSKMNGRDVYADPNGNFHSVDTQHGRFERLNGRGEHLGEYNIDGVNTKGPDTSGRHNIRCG